MENNQPRGGNSYSTSPHHAVPDYFPITVLKQCIITLVWSVFEADHSLAFNRFLLHISMILEIWKRPALEEESHFN